MRAKKTARKSSHKTSSGRKMGSKLKAGVENTANKARRTVKKAAQNVHSNAERAIELGAALIRAGELIQEGASFLDSVAVRVSGSRNRR